MKTTLLSFTLLALTVTSAHAANLFVRPNGSGNLCTASLPCGSLQVAVDSAGPGVRIHVNPGTYVENITIPGG